MITESRLIGIALISLAITVYALFTNKTPIENGKKAPVVITLYLFFFMLVSAIIFGSIMIFRG